MGDASYGGTGGNGITGGGGGRITIEATSYSGQAVMNGGSATDGAPGSIGVFSFVKL